MKNKILISGLSISILISGTPVVASNLNYNSNKERGEVIRNLNLEKDKVRNLKDKEKIREKIEEEYKKINQEKIKDITEEFKGYNYDNISEKIEGIKKGLEKSKNFKKIDQNRINSLEKRNKDIEIMLKKYTGDTENIKDALNSYKDMLNELEGVDVKKVTDKLEILIENLGEEKKIKESKEDLVEGKVLKDVKKDNWFYRDVTDLVKKGGLSGYSDGTFRPNKEISLGEFLKLAMTSVIDEDFAKTEGNHWAKPYYDRAIKEGIIEEGDFGTTNDDFNKPINREDMSYILMNINEKIQKEMGESIEKNIGNISDYKKITENRRSKVLQSYKKGIMAGKGGKFEPKSHATRAEAATVIMRLINKDNRIK